MKSTPILAPGLLVAAHADEPFVRKAGEWRMTVFQKDGRTDPPEKSCYGNATVADITKGMGDCAKHDIRTNGGTRPMGTFHIVIAAMGYSFYHSEMHVTYSPPISGTSDVDIATDATWLGPFPAGEKPTNWHILADNTASR